MKLAGIGGGQSDGPVDETATIIEAIEAEGWRLDQMNVAMSGPDLAPKQQGYFLFRRAAKEVK